MKCNGEWLSGSGGHIVWSYDCEDQAVIVDVETGEMFCYAHIPRDDDEFGVHPSFDGYLAPIGSLKHKRSEAERALLDAIHSLGWPGKFLLFLSKILGRFSK